MSSYLEDGVLDILGIQYRLQNGFVVNRQKLLPQAFIVTVDEPEFGCEGRPDTEAVYAKVHALTMQGQKTWLIGEKDLEQSGIYDNMWVCILAKDKQLVCWREGTDEILPFSEEIWNRKLEEP